MFAQPTPNNNAPVPFLGWLVLAVCVALVAAGVLVALLATRKRRRRARMAAAPPRPPAVRLTVTDLHGNTTAMERTVDRALFVGNGPANDIVFDDVLMGEQQFVIENRDGAYTITGLSEVWPTYVNDEKIDIAHPLCHGDIIVAGRQVILFERVRRTVQQLFFTD